MKKILNIAIFIFSAVSMIISIQLFLKMGVYMDEYNTSIDIVYGGIPYVYMDWLRLGMSGLICLISGINLIRIKGE